MPFAPQGDPDAEWLKAVWQLWLIQPWLEAIDSETCYGAEALLTLGSAPTAEAPPMPTASIEGMADGQPDEIAAGWLLDTSDPHDPAQSQTSYSYMGVPYDDIFYGAPGTEAWER